MIYRSLSAVLMVLWLSAFSQAQLSRIDSLELELKKDLHDTTRVNRYILLSQECRVAGDLDKALSYGKKGIELSEKSAYYFGMARCLHLVGNVHLGFGEFDKASAYYEKAINFWKVLSRSADTSLVFKARTGIAAALGNIGLVHQYKSDYPKALEYHFKSMKIREEQGDKINIAGSLGNIGLVYQNMSDYPKALEYQLKSLKIEESVGNARGIGRALGNIGIIYSLLGDWKKSLEYEFRCLDLFKELGDKLVVANTLGNIGVNYFDLQDYPKALEYQLQSLKIEEELNDKRGMQAVYNNIGSIYENTPDSVCALLNIKPSEKYDKALESQQKSYDICVEIGDKQGRAVALGDMASVFLKQKKYSKAIEFARQGAALAHEIGDVYNEKDILFTLYMSYKGADNMTQALVHHEKFILIRDSIFKEEKQKDIMRKQMDYEYEKKENAIKAEREKERALSAVEARRQKTITWSVAGGLVLVIVFSGFMFNRWRVTQQQKKIIEVQKNLVDEKNRHITDSINYAKRIQESLLLSEEEIRKIVPFETFILYRPKDIVSGDFYWISAPGSLPGDQYIVAAADCTGHGVPGAFLSTIGSMLLNEVVNERKITDPAAILQELHDGMYHALHHENESTHSQDGMDISLCLIDRKKNLLRYAGACSPLYIVYKEDHSFRLEICKPDVLSIGDKTHFNSTDVSFTPYETALRPGMQIYLFSDGYMDQFNRKLKQRIGSKQFQKYILDSAALSMSGQKQYLSKTLADWMGTDKQVDDVLVMGIRI